MPKVRASTAPKGVGNRGKGRPRGVPNKSTQNAREAIARFVDDNADRVQGWLEQIAENDGPRAAYQCWLDLVEYHIPKLARTEHTGKDGGAIIVQGAKHDDDL